MAWFNGHIALIRSRPTNGRKAMREIEFLLLEINNSRERVDNSSNSIIADAQQAKEIVAQGKDVLGIHKS